jgi:hypothetical protein
MASLLGVKMDYKINNGCHVYRVVDIPSIPDTDVCLKFQSQGLNTEHPELTQEKFQMIISKDDLVRLGTHLIELGAK